jgi:hypothetical protein
VKLFYGTGMTPRHDFIDFLLTEQHLACFLLARKNIRLEKSVVQIYQKFTPKIVG